MTKVLHITNWYPNQWNEHETPFIKEQFRAVSGNCQSQLWHLQVRNEGPIFRFFSGKRSDFERFFILDTKICSWRLIEFLTLFLLIALRIRLGRKWWDLVHIHIAYPLMRFPRVIKLLFGSNLVISEHWSAYRLDFHLPDGSAAKGRIQQIFHHKIPVISVSHALMDDITRFAGTVDFPQNIVSNIVDPEIFHPAARMDKEEGPVFLMVGSWAPIKRPLLVMEAFASIAETLPTARLRIVGYGPQWTAMDAFVRDNGLEDRIALLGAMSKSNIAEEMRQADAFVHASNYETFSVVCAEALCCGLPVIASNVGGIPEFVNSGNGILVENTLEAWVSALYSFEQKNVKWNFQDISTHAIGMFSPAAVGEKLAEVYSQCCGGGKG